jgi:RNA polymerase sigma factor (sigma-70 family)
MSAVDFSSELSGLRSTLKTFTRRFTLDRDESSDLVQDTLLKALMNRDKFTAGTNLKGWLFTIMRNTFINNYRRSRLHPAAYNISASPAIQVQEHYTFNLPDTRFEYNDIVKKVNQLKNELLMPFSMHTSGYKYHEIAEHLNLPIGTVKNRIFQARKEIQKKLMGY